LDEPKRKARGYAKNQNRRVFVAFSTDENHASDHRTQQREHNENRLRFTNGHCAFSDCFTEQSRETHKDYSFIRGVNYGMYGGQVTIERVHRISEEMQTYWTNFAKTGDPNGGGLPEWPMFNTTSRPYLDPTDDGTVARGGLRRHACCGYLEMLEQEMAH
jgi:hypothetical protein